MPLYHLEIETDIHYAVYKNLITKKFSAKYMLPEPYMYENAPLYTCKTAKCILEKRAFMYEQDGIWYNIVDENGSIIDPQKLELLLGDKNK